MILYILAAILIFGLLIVAHEFGHFLVAKSCGVRVNEFSICMGPTIWKRQHGETLYSLRCIPLGGYCVMEGETEGSDDPRSFSAAGFLKKMAILLAGSAANFLVGFLILTILCSGAKSFLTPRVNGFYEGVAEETGLQVGDEILKIGSDPVFLANDIPMLLERGHGVCDLTVRRDGRRITLENVPLQLREFEKDGKKTLKYGLIFTLEEANAASVLKIAWRSTLDDARLVWLGLRDLISGAIGLDAISGPVGIVSVIAETGQQAGSSSAAVRAIAYIGAFLAVNLAVMNLLPIPALDGGRAFLLLVKTVMEKLLRRPIPDRYENYIHSIGMLLLLLFIAWLTMKDVIHLFR